MKHLIAVLCILACILAAGCVNAPVPGPDITPAPGQTADPADETEIPAGSFAVTVLSDPPGASILVDGEYTGKTAPDTIAVSAGTHTITAESSHGQRSSEELKVAEDRTIELRITQEKTLGKFLTEKELSKTGWAVVRASQQYVYVSVNGRQANSVRYNLEGTAMRDTVETPYVIPGLKEGLVSIKVEPSGLQFDTGSGYDSGEFPIVSGIYSWLYFLVNGNEPMDVLAVTSEAYAGYPYSVDGYLSAGLIPETREWPVSCDYVSVLTDEGYVSYLRDSMDRTLLKIEPREVVWHDLYVTSSPSGADILVDGFPTGYTTPWTIQNVSDGFHRITVSKPGYLPVEKELVLAGTTGTEQISMPAMSEYSSGYLLVDADEPGSYIMMYGKDTGDRTPTVYPAVPIGNRDITIMSGSGVTKTETVMILPDAMNTLKVSFKN
ncbi:MAG: PEGA domain-containing protein [Methanocorpusculum sp.]|nr:PEGA domain-containing protein [Methanocorpusculum sp.]MDE2521614.1 PEGA domain-containing protein [Methanocorpusculum sp.]MDE2525444.1 PEGA domain-containing protein [Methanocorpusculum sp.]